jgi:hypothetical protein
MQIDDDDDDMLLHFTAKCEYFEIEKELISNEEM